MHRTVFTLPKSSALLTLASQPQQFFCSPQSSIHWSCCYWKSGFASWWMLNQKIQPSRRAEKEGLTCCCFQGLKSLSSLGCFHHPQALDQLVQVCMCMQHVSVQDYLLTLPPCLVSQLANIFLAFKA